MTNIRDPKYRIALHLVAAGIETDRAETERQATQLAALIDPQRDICPSCWRLYSNGTRGRTSHDAENCIVG
jgi:hypothetical protein